MPCRAPQALPTVPYWHAGVSMHPLHVNRHLVTVVDPGRPPPCTPHVTQGWQLCGTAGSTDSAAAAHATEEQVAGRFASAAPTRDTQTAACASPPQRSWRARSHQEGSPSGLPPRGGVSAVALDERRNCVHPRGVSVLLQWHSPVVRRTLLWRVTTRRSRYTRRPLHLLAGRRRSRPRSRSSSRGRDGAALKLTPRTRL
jgi:hypothetical protein